MNKKVPRLLVIIFCLYFIVTTIQAIADLWKAGDKLTQRKKRVETLQKEQDTLLARQFKVNSPSYWEKIARDQLGLSKEGEEIIIIPQELLIDRTRISSEPAIPNWQKWVKLVF